MEQTVSRKLTLYSFWMSVFVMLAHYKVPGTLIHSTRPAWDEGLYLAFDDRIEQLVSLAMMYFFFTSAFLFYRNATPRNVWNKMKGRLYSLGVPLVVWTTLKVVLHILWARELPAHSLQDWLIIYTVQPLDGPLWYLTALLLLMLPAPLLVWGKGRPLVSAALCVFFYWYARYGWFPAFADERYWIFMSRWMVQSQYYFLGVFLAQTLAEPILREQYPRRLAQVLSLVVLVYYFGAFSLPEAAAPLHSVLRLLVPAAAWLLVDSRWLKKPVPFGLQIGFFLYASHELMIQFIGKIRDPILLHFLGGMEWRGWQLVALRSWQALRLYLLTLLAVWLARKLLPPKLYGALSGNRVR
ncbi:MAG: acyltransferase family protein [Gemmiger sp.]